MSAESRRRRPKSRGRGAHGVRLQMFRETKWLTLGVSGQATGVRPPPRRKVRVSPVLASGVGADLRVAPASARGLRTSGPEGGRRELVAGQLGVWPTVKYKPGSRVKRGYARRQEFREVGPREGLTFRRDPPSPL